jgi:RNA polymerase sigma-70 factor, ECF subfamily
MQAVTDKYAENSDEELFVSYLSGDELAFESIVRKYKVPLYTVIFRMVGDKMEAQDIFQETFIRVIRYKNDFDTNRKFSSWMYTIATNLCRDHFRKKSRAYVMRTHEIPELAGHTTPEDERHNKEIRDAVEKAVKNLPEVQREVFVLREYAGLTFKEISKITGTKINTVLGRMHLAVKKLRIELAGFMEEGA